MTETFDTIRAHATRTPFAMPVRFDRAPHAVVTFPTGAPVAEPLVAAPSWPPREAFFEAQAQARRQARERASYAAERRAFAEQRRQHYRRAAALTLAIVLVGPLLTVLITGLPGWPV